MRRLRNLKLFSIFSSLNANNIIVLYYKSFIVTIFHGQRIFLLAIVALLLFYYIFGFLITLLSLFIGFIFYIYTLCDTLLYNPYNPPDSRINVPNPKSFGLNFDNLFIYTQDGRKIHMQFIKRPTPDQCPTLIYFHGNAGNIGHRLINAIEFYHQIQCNILMVEYRGYGLSDGKPSEHGLYLDALAAWKFLQNCEQIDRTKIILFGRSLGGAVAVALAYEFRRNKYLSASSDTRNQQSIKPAAMILENTFTSVPDISRHLFTDHYQHRIRYLGRLLSLIPDWFYKSRFNSVHKITMVNTPTIFISGLSDELVPPKMMTKLFKRSSAVYKEMHEFENGVHNGTWKCSNYYQTIKNFLKTVFDNNYGAKYNHNHGNKKCPKTFSSIKINEDDNDDEDTALLLAKESSPLTMEVPMDSVEASEGV